MRFPLARNIIRAQSIHNTFGTVRTGKDGKPRVHQGWDFAASIGTPFFAVADGTVSRVGTHEDYGFWLLLDIGGGRYAFYAHLQDHIVNLGEAVNEGQHLGHTGNSGNAVTLHDADDHLHFEARLVKSPGLGLGGRVSPLAWFGTCPLHEPATA